MNGIIAIYYTQHIYSVVDHTIIIFGSRLARAIIIFGSRLARAIDLWLKNTKKEKSQIEGISDKNGICSWK